MSEQERQQDEPALVYTNVVQMHVQSFDLIMDFGFKSPEDFTPVPSEDGTEQGESDGKGWSLVARVAMSHAHAKSMLPVLARLIAEFESQVGPIATPGFDTHSKE